MSKRITPLVGGTLLAIGSVTVGYLLGRTERVPAEHSDNAPPATTAPDLTPTAIPSTTVNAAAPASNPASADETISPRTVAGIIERCKDIFAMDNYHDRRYHNEMVFDAMTAEQAPEVLAALQDLPAGEIAAQLKLFFFARWGQLDGAAAVEAALNLSDRVRGTLAGTAVSGWASRDPEAAWQVARELADGWPTFAYRANGVFTEMAKRDLSAALALQSELPPGSPLENTHKSAVIQFAVEEGRLDEVLRSVMSFESVEAQKAWVGRIFSSWATIDDQAPLAALERIADPALADQAMSGFLSGWSASDPEGAIDYMLAHRDDTAAARILPMTLMNLMRQSDRTTMLALTERLSSAKDFEELLQPIFGIVAVQHPDIALQLTAKITDEKTRSRFTSISISGWARNDFGAAATYFEQLPPGAAKTQALTSMGYAAMTREDGGDRISGWINSIPPGSERTEAVERLLSAANSAYVTPTANTRAALKQLVDQTPELSDTARANAQKLFGDGAGGKQP